MADLEHIAIIMDGNGRWAKKRNLPRTEGHAEGAKRVGDVIKWAKKYISNYDEFCKRLNKLRKEKK